MNFPGQIYVVPVHRFHSCLSELSKSMPPTVVVRLNNFVVLMYGFADASGSCFTSILLVKEHIYYMIGTWSRTEYSTSYH